jgi:hypothetical protein
MKGVNAQYNFDWVDTINFKLTGNCISRLDSNSFTAANSSVHLPFNSDGFAEVTIDSHQSFSFSLTSCDAENNYLGQDYVFLFSESGSILIYYYGELLGTFGEYLNGDKFKITKINGSITFVKNDVITLATIHTMPSELLFVSISLLSSCSQIKNIFTSTNFVQNKELIWDKLSNLIIESDIFTNITGDEWGHVGCISKNFIGNRHSDSGYFAFSTNQEASFSFGLISQPEAFGYNFNQMDCGILIEEGSVKLFKNGELDCDCGSYNLSDVFAIKISGRNISIIKNGIELVYYVNLAREQNYIAFALKENLETKIKTFCSPGFLINHDINWAQKFGVVHDISNHSIIDTSTSIFTDSIKPFSISEDYLPVLKNGEFDFKLANLDDIFIGIADKRVLNANSAYWGLYFYNNGHIRLLNDGNIIDDDIGVYVQGDKVKVKISGTDLIIELNENQIYSVSNLEVHESKKLYIVCCFYTAGSGFTDFTTTFAKRFRASVIVKDPLANRQGGSFGFKFEGGSPPYHFTINDSTYSSYMLDPGIYTANCFDSKEEMIGKTIYIGRKLEWLCLARISVVQDSSSLIKHADNGWGDSEGFSKNLIDFNQNNNWIEFTLDNPSSNFYVGFREKDDSDNVESSSYSLQIDSGNVYVLEIHPDGLANKALVGNNARKGDIFHIVQNADGINYFINDIQIYQTPYFFKKANSNITAGIYSKNTVISNVRSNAIVN